MVDEVAAAGFPSSFIQSTNLKKGNSFGSNIKTCNEPISVLDTWSPSPSPSTSTSSFSFTPNCNPPPVNQKWPEEMSISESLPNLAGGYPKDEWSDLHPIPLPEFGLGVEVGLQLDEWERLVSESGGSHDQSLLRWISGDVDDTSVTLKQLLLQVNQNDENAPPAPLHLTQQIYINSQMMVNINPSQIQFHPPGVGISLAASDQSHEFLLNKQNQQQQQKSTIAAAAAVAKQFEPRQKQLIYDQLFAAAEQLMLSGNFSNAQGILARLNHHLPSPMSMSMSSYNPIQRSAFYFKEALQTQMVFPIPNSNPTVSNGMFKMCAYKLLSEVSPIIQFMNFTSNQALLEAVSDSNHIHIIDFDIGFGAQWASFIQELLPRKNTNGNVGGGCSLKITAFASPSTHHPVELGLMHENLSQFAHQNQIPFQLEIVNFDSFDPDTFSVSGNDAIAVNFPIWSTSTRLPAIPALLHFIKQLSPRIVVALDRGCERTDLPFPQYLLHGVNYYEVLLNSIDAANVPPYTANKIEKFLLQPQIESMVSGKLQSPEPMPHWRTLFTTGGYFPVSLSNFAEAQADCVVKRSQVRGGFHVEKSSHSSLVLCWQNCQLMGVSAWRC